MLPAACQKHALYRSIGFLIGACKRQQRERGEFEGITLIVCHGGGGFIQILYVVEAKDSRCWAMLQS
jgi:hypothetical protein